MANLVIESVGSDGDNLTLITKDRLYLVKAGSLKIIDLMVSHLQKIKKITELRQLDPESKELKELEFSQMARKI